MAVAAVRSSAPDAIVGPSITFTTTALTMGSASARTLVAQLTIARLLGSLGGLAVGFVVIVYVPGVW
jgi:hypothetical protein